MDNIDRKILIELGGDVEVRSDFYEHIAEKLGIDTEEVIERLRVMEENKMLKRIAPIVKHHKTRFVHNGMSVWKVEAQRVGEVSEIILGYDQISHVYERETGGDWDYNLFAMIHSTSRDEVEKIVRNIANKAKLSDYRVLYTAEEIKKTSPDLKYLLK